MTLRRKMTSNRSLFRWNGKRRTARDWPGESCTSSSLPASPPSPRRGDRSSAQQSAREGRDSSRSGDNSRHVPSPPLPHRCQCLRRRSSTQTAGENARATSCPGYRPPGRLSRPRSKSAMSAGCGAPPQVWAAVQCAEAQTDGCREKNWFR